MESYKKIIIAILIISILAFLYFRNSQNDYVSISTEDNLRAEIEELEYQKRLLEDNLSSVNSKMEEKLSSANSRIEELEREYNYYKELCELLRNQLESFGIEPKEL